MKNKSMYLYIKRILLVGLVLAMVNEPLHAATMDNSQKKLNEIQQQAKGWTKKQFIEKLDEAYRTFQKKMKALLAIPKGAARGAVVVAAGFAILTLILLQALYVNTYNIAVYPIHTKVAPLYNKFIYPMELQMYRWKLERKLKSETKNLRVYIERLEAYLADVPKGALKKAAYFKKYPRHASYFSLLARLKRRFALANGLWKQYKKEQNLDILWSIYPTLQTELIFYPELKKILKFQDWTTSYKPERMEPAKGSMGGFGF